MTRLSTFLKDADPLRHDPPRRDVDREHLRQTILRAPAVDGMMIPARSRPRLLAASAAIAIVAAVMLGYQLWTDSSARLLAAVRFEVRLAEDTPIAGLVVAQVADSGRLVYLHPEIVVSNDDISQSWVYQDDAGGFGVAMKFLPSGAERMQQATKAHVGRPLAILIDGKVVSVPVLRATISDSATINGRFAQAEATRIADGIDRP